MTVPPLRPAVGAVTVPPLRPAVGAVTVPPLRRNLRGLLYPAALWLLLRGGRKICKAGQACGRLVPFVLPLAPDDAYEVLTRPVH